MTYEVGVFERGEEDVRAVGGFVHVLVERANGKTVEWGIGGEAREGLEKIMVVEGEGAKETTRAKAKL